MFTSVVLLCFVFFANSIRKAKSTWDKLRKERDFHRMHHRRVVQEKNALLVDMKRLKKVRFFLINANLEINRVEFSFQILCKFQINCINASSSMYRTFC